MAREAQTLAAAGFDGLYLDNLDVADLHPRTATGVVKLVEGLADAAPDLLLVAQNGLAVADRLPIDGLAHEDVFWRWDGRYRPSSAAERAALLPGLRALRDRGLPIFTLDYAKPGSPGADEALASSLAEGFRPAVSVLEPRRAAARRAAGLLRLALTAPGRRVRRMPPPRRAPPRSAAGGSTSPFAPSGSSSPP